VDRPEAEARAEQARLDAARRQLERKSEQVSRETAAAAQQAAALNAQWQRAQRDVDALQGRLQEQQQRLERLRANERARRDTTPESVLWVELAGEVATEAALRSFFERRQRRDVQQRLRIASAWKVTNGATLRGFASAGSFDIDPLQAHTRGGDTLLLHGCSQEAATNVMATGLLLSFAAHGMLGRGLYGAPDPRKSVQCCKSANKFMFICRYNLAGAQHAGPSTQHRNTLFDEFCVYREAQVVVLWAVKLA